MAKNTGIAQFSQGRADMHRVDPRLLVLEKGWNTREEGAELDEHIDMLAQSIAEVGVKQPISVKLIDGKMVVRNGHCRTRAAMLAIEKYGADIKTVPVIAFDRYANDADMVLDQIISNSGKPLSVMEEARVYKKLLDMGWEQVAIAKKVGKSAGRISQILDLLTMPAAVQTMVANGTVSASLAAKTVSQSDNALVAIQALTTAAAQAKADGREKVKPADVGMETSAVKQTKTFKEAFENSDIDNSEAESGYVIIKMPHEDFEFIRQALKL